MTPPKKPEFSPLSLVRMLWKQKLLIGVVAVLGCAAALVIVHRLPAIYQADALILVDSQKIPEQYVASTVNTNVQDRLATISQQILSATRLQKIIDNFGLYSQEKKKKTPEEIIELMRKDINIKLERGWSGNQPGAFHVVYQGQNPALVADVANQLANLFIDENLQTRERQAEGTASFIDSELEAAKKTLDEDEAKLSHYKVEHNGELPQQEENLNQTLSRLQVELTGNQDATNRAQQNKTMLQSALNIAQAEEEAFSRPVRSGQAPETDGRAVPDPVKKSELLQQQYDTLKLRYKPDFPDMQVLRAEIDHERKLEAEAAAKASKAAVGAAGATGEAAADAAEPVSRELMQARERVESVKSQIKLAEQEIAARSAERKQIIRDIAAYQARLERVPLREQEMAQITRGYEISKDNYKSLLDKKLAAGMATDMEHRQQAERFTLLDPAVVPGKPVKPNRLAFSLLGCAASLGLALGIAAGKEIQKNTLLGEWEIASEIAILGRVPVIRPGGISSQGSSMKLRAAVASSGLLAILAIVLAGAHFYLRWF